VLKIALNPDASREYRDAYNWYEQQRLGLGAEFLQHMQTCFDHICEHPLAYPVIWEPLRCKSAGRFPYQILYSVEDDTICVWRYSIRVATRGYGNGVFSESLSSSIAAAA
jgi:plasmid stabilization system protein ParE